MEEKREYISNLIPEFKSLKGFFRVLFKTDLFYVENISIEYNDKVTINYFKDYSKSHDVLSFENSKSLNDFVKLFMKERYNLEFDDENVKDYVLNDNKKNELDKDSILISAEYTGEEHKYIMEIIEYDYKWNCIYSDKYELSKEEVKQIIIKAIDGSSNKNVFEFKMGQGLKSH